MHDHTAVPEGTNGGPLAVGFLIGAAVGAGVALLLAPASGAHTRRRLGRVAERLRNEFDHGVGEVRSRLADARDDVSAAIDAGRQTFAHERESRRSGSESADRTASS